MISIRQDCVPGSMVHASLVSLLLFLSGLMRAAEGLVVEVRVPAYKIRGEDAELQCHYMLQDATLYSLKWYKGDSQFYQYIPANRETKTTFEVPGLQVDISKSSVGKVKLVALQLAASGSYRCEVITEAPQFFTQFGEGNMTIVDLPVSAPVLEGAHTAYEAGDLVNINCSSPCSKPAATLEWFVNEHRVTDSVLRRFSPIQEQGGLETAVLGLFFRVTKRHFQSGHLQLKCTARIASIYYQSQETSVRETNFLPQTQAEESRRYPFSFFNSASSLLVPLHFWLLLALVHSYVV
ncbi:Immunoglobulin V-set domain [Trinorchestia longiramus]|nr:Immunoglobulin V-set domain [Trinorchestia longiramus]